MFKNPSPRMKPYSISVSNVIKGAGPEAKETTAAGLTDARTMSGVSAQPILDLHHQLNTPPTVRASVKDGTLYMPVSGWLVKSERASRVNPP
jgi:hypothetical protein